MPYNTRRKSLSLPSLGIHVPSSHPRTNRHSISNTSSMPSPKSTSESSNERPNKRVKRIHISTTKVDRMPPPSLAVQKSIEKDDSTSAEVKTIDLEAINDEIVQAVIARLQETSNRPHLIKDLSTVLMGQLKVVQQYVFFFLSFFFSSSSLFSIRICFSLSPCSSPSLRPPPSPPSIPIPSVPTRALSVRAFCMRMR